MSQQRSTARRVRRRRRLCTCCSYVTTVLFLLLAGDASCLAVSHPGPSTQSPNNGKKITGVVSTRTDSGVSKTFSFTSASSKEKRKGPLKFFGSNNNHDPNNNRGVVHRLGAGFRSTFLPLGFPYRTPPGYLSYSIWSWIQDLSTQLRSVLATQRVLEGVGVGREGATALSALMNYIVRDGCGMGASLLFTSAASSRFKSDVKRWRLFADIMVDIGITLEVAATIVPPALFLPMISVGNMCKAICGVTAGACGGAINLHWAEGSDISDINAKFGAQQTVTGSLGLVFAAVFARSVSRVQERKLWAMYLYLTQVHIFANMQCMRLVAFDTLNTARMNLVALEFFDWWNDNAQDDINAGNSEHDSYTGERVPLSSPEEVSRIEPLFFVRKTSRRQKEMIPYPIHFGVSFDEFSKQTQKTVTEMEELVESCANQEYIIALGPGKKRKGGVVAVSLSTEATPRDEAKAYFHALLLNQEIAKNATQSHDEAQQAASSKLNLLWSAFEKGARLSGWDLSKTVLRTAGYEYSLQSQ